MVLSKRERLIAIGVAIALAVLLLDRYLLTPYAQRAEKVTIAQSMAIADTSKAAELLTQQPKQRSAWAQYQRDGLKFTPSSAESQAQNALLEWARGSGVSIASVKPERSVQENAFTVINFSVTGTGTMASITKMLYTAESASIPVRINELKIDPRREATDDLSLRLSLSTLCATNDTPKQPETRGGR
jgi:hypothetical protein